MDRSRGITASEIVNTYAPGALVKILRTFGEEKFATRIVENIVKARAKAPLNSTQELAALVKESIPAATRRTGGNPAKRTFQALRIAVNDELGAIERAIPQALSRIVVAPKRIHLATCIALVALAIGVSHIVPRGSDTNETRNVAAVQGGGPQGTLAINTNSRDVVDRHLAATRQIVATDLDMVIWPENVIDVDNFYDSKERIEVAEQAARLNAQFVVGITEDLNRQYFTNAQVVVNEDGTLGDRYDKVRRVPFGEFVPLRGLLETLGAPVDRIPRDALAGSDIAQLRVADTTIGVAISWEVFFSGRANEGVEAGGSMLVNPTNGSSYTGTILQSQQVASSRLRAIENGRWLVQISPTGFSAFVSPTGKVYDRTGVSEQRVLIREIPLRTGRTIYSNLGDLPFIMVMVATLGSLVFLGRKRNSLT
jgi:apolipoprotein N-acyltransferase